MEPITTDSFAAVDRKDGRIADASLSTYDTSKGIPSNELCECFLFTGRFVFPDKEGMVLLCIKRRIGFMQIPLMQNC